MIFGEFWGYSTSTIHPLKKKTQRSSWDVGSPRGVRWTRMALMTCWTKQHGSNSCGNGVFLRKGSTFMVDFHSYVSLLMFSARYLICTYSCTWMHMISSCIYIYIYTIIFIMFLLLLLLLLSFYYYCWFYCIFYSMIVCQYCYFYCYYYHCTYIYTYIYTHLHIYIYTYIHIYIYIFTRVYIYILTCVCVCVCVCVWVCVCLCPLAGGPQRICCQRSSATESWGVSRLARVIIPSDPQQLHHVRREAPWLGASFSRKTWLMRPNPVWRISSYHQLSVKT